MSGRTILSIDGGGIRGVIPALVLAAIEDGTEHRIHELFDVIAGTSTGGILALGLTLPRGEQARYTAAELAALYREQGKEIFPGEFLGKMRQFFGPKYPERGRRAVLEGRFGDARLQSALTEVFVTSYDIAGQQPFFFRREDARKWPGRDFRMSDAALATSAAPTYFPPVKLHEPEARRDLVLVDGGVFANNPSMCGYVDRVAGNAEDGDTLIVSLGTGEPQPRPIAYGRARHWGLIGWARRLIDVIFAGVTETTEYELDQILPKGKHERYQPKLPKADEALDAPKHVEALERIARTMIRDRESDIAALCKVLRERRGL
jgi:predicted acylesterase/phospholipase RssA